MLIAKNILMKHRYYNLYQSTCTFWCLLLMSTPQIQIAAHCNITWFFRTIITVTQIDAFSGPIISVVIGTYLHFDQFMTIQYLWESW